MDGVYRTVFRGILRERRKLSRQHLWQYNMPSQIELWGQGRVSSADEDFDNSLKLLVPDVLRPMAKRTSRSRWWTEGAAKREKSPKWDPAAEGEVKLGEIQTAPARSTSSSSSSSSSAMASHVFGRPALPDARTLRREFFEPILDLHRRELARPGSAKDQLGSLNEEEGTSSPTRGKKAKAYATGSSSSSTSQPSNSTNNAPAAGNKKGGKASEAAAAAGKGFDTSSLGVTKGGANIAGKQIGEKKNYSKEEKQLIEDEVNKALDAYLQGKADGTAATATATPTPA